MKNPDLIHESSQSLMKLAEKIVLNLENVNFAFSDFRRESTKSARLGVCIDWSKGTIALESNRQ